MQKLQNPNLSDDLQKKKKKTLRFLDSLHANTDASGLATSSQPIFNFPRDCCHVMSNSAGSFSDCCDLVVRRSAAPRLANEKLNYSGVGVSRQSRNFLPNRRAEIHTARRRMHRVGGKEKDMECMNAWIIKGFAVACEDTQVMWPRQPICDLEVGHWSLWSDGRPLGFLHNWAISRVMREKNTHFKSTDLEWLFQCVFVGSWSDGDWPFTLSVIKQL